MPTFTYENHDQTQNGRSASHTAAYDDAVGEQSIGIAQGQVIWVRIPHTIPAGATINSATLTLRGGVKDGAVTQSSLHSVSGLRHANAPRLVQGNAVAANGTNGGALTTNYTNFTASWSANQSGQWVSPVNVTAIVQEIVNLSGFLPGGYITFGVYCSNENGSDMNIGSLSSFDEVYHLAVTYTDNYPDTRWDVNTLRNSSFSTNVATWELNDAFGGLNVAGATITRDTTFHSRPVLRFNTPAPSGTKATGFASSTAGTAGVHQIFCGWLYIPSSVTAEVTAEFMYVGTPTRTIIPARNQWTPFCTVPYDFPTDGRNRIPHVNIASGYTQGQAIYLSEPAVLYSKVREISFASDYVDTVGFDFTATDSVGYGQVVRKYNSKKRAHNGSAIVPANTYRMRPDGLWNVTPTVKL